MRTYGSAAALAAAFVLGAAGAAAQTAPQQALTPLNGMVEYFGCDGYGPPGPSGDGMTAFAGGGAGIFQAWIPGDTSKTAVRVGGEGVRFCDAALASNEVRPYAMRQVDLLLSRAAHKLVNGDTAGARADVAAARTTIAPSGPPLYDRSLGLSVDFVDAYVLAVDGQGAEAVRRARGAYEQRPYGKGAAIAALLAAEATGRDADIEAMLRAAARLHPAALDELYLMLLNRGRWADALAVFPQMPGPRDTSNAPRYAHDEFPDLEAHRTIATYWLRRGGWRAYALAADGKPAEARAALAETRELLAEAIKPSVPPMVVTPSGRKKPGRLSGPKARYETMMKTSLAASGGDLLDAWAPLVEARARLAEGDTAGALALVEGAAARRPPEQAAWADLAGALRERLPASDKARAPAVPKPGPDTNLKADLGTLLEVLPRAEIPKTLPRYEAKASAGKGWQVTATAEGAAVYFHDRKATAPEAVGEAALLRAADLTLAAGKPGMILLSRDDVERTETIVSGGIPGPTIPIGYSTQLRVLFVDPAALPADYEAWRVLDAAAVRAALAPVYAAEQ